MTPSIALPEVSFTIGRSSVAAQQVLAALDDGGPGALSAAFAAFNTLHTVCGAAITAVNAANFGPFANSGSCDYDCGFKEQKWSWSANFTSYAQQTLIPSAQGMDILGAFTNACSPIQQWLNDLPGYNTNITNAIATINQIDAVIKSTGTETPAQQQALAQAFSTALSQVQSSLKEANAALQNLSGFLSWVSGRTISTQPYQSAVDNSITNSMNNLIGQIACGADEVRSQFGAMQSTVDASFASVQTPPFTNVNNQFNTSTDAGDVVAGVFLNIQVDSATVTEFLNKAQNVSPTSPLRGPYLGIASTDWGSLVSYAQTQLST